MLKTIRRILKFPLTFALSLPFVRKRAAYHFHEDYFGDLLVSIPLGDKFWCPLPTRDSIHSFSEIFVSDEYGSFLRDIPLPGRWLDLGCHTGYFSLYLAWKHSLAGTADGWRALLIDADPRMEAFTRRVLGANGLLQACEFRSGLISARAGDQPFALREGMGSSSDTGMHGVLGVEKVRVIPPSEILAALPPPYDLIKIDIEGGEVDFVQSYKEVYKHASAILMEWHSHDKEGSAAVPLRAALEENGFSFVRTLRPRRELKFDSGWYSSGVELYRRNAGG